MTSAKARLLWDGSLVPQAGGPHQAKSRAGLVPTMKPIEALGHLAYWTMRCLVRVFSP